MNVIDLVALMNHSERLLMDTARFEQVTSDNYQHLFVYGGIERETIFFKALKVYE